MVTWKQRIRAALVLSLLFGGAIPSLAMADDTTTSEVPAPPTPTVESPAPTTVPSTTVSTTTAPASTTSNPSTSSPTVTSASTTTTDPVAGTGDTTTSTLVTTTSEPDDSDEGGATTSSATTDTTVGSTTDSIVATQGSTSTTVADPTSDADDSGGPDDVVQRSTAEALEVAGLDVAFMTVDPTDTIAIDKTNTAGGGTPDDDGIAQPGDNYTYNFLASCSNINVDCVNFQIVDTFPGDVIVDESTLPGDVPGQRVVDWDAGTQTLTVTYIEPLSNPQGALGKVAGTSDSFIVGVTLPEDTPLLTDAVIPNEATVSADNVAGTATDPSPVTVDIPRIVDVSTTKSFTPQSVIAGETDAGTTMELTASNESSSSSEVTEMVIEDSTAATYEYLDVSTITVQQYPAGATGAQLYVCEEGDAPCADGDWQAAGSGTAPGPSTLSTAPVAADQVVGVRVVFTAPDGSFMTPTTGPGDDAIVDIDTVVRDTVRTSGDDIEAITSTVIIDNVVNTSVTDPDADVPTADADDTAQFQILPPILDLDISKSFFPDANGDYDTDAGEHAVIGEPSGVSMVMDAVNTSAFPISEITITEPVDPSEFDKVDASSIRLTFPAGAATASVVVDYEPGPDLVADYPAPGPTDVALDTSRTVESVTVTFSGPDNDGDGFPDPTIEPGATASLGVHGNLNDGVDASDLASNGGSVANCAEFDGSGGSPLPGTNGTFNGEACSALPIEGRNGNAGGTKTASQNQIPADEPVRFNLTTTNNGNLPLIDLVVADPPLAGDGTPDSAPTFEYGQLIDATVTSSSASGTVTVEVYDGTAWVPLSSLTPVAYDPVLYPGLLVYPQVTGVKATASSLLPTESFNLQIDMISRDPADWPSPTPPETFQNCYSVTADTSDPADDPVVLDSVCGPPISPTPIDEAAAINKAIAPEQLPRPIPGMDPEVADVTLEIFNSGNINARTLQITDVDSDFWDAVDFVGFGNMTPPAVGVGDADLLQIDAFVGGAWIDGTPASPGSPALPDDGGTPVAPEDVRGLRFTYSSSLTDNSGFVMTPCDGSADCLGVIKFQVSPRLSLLSTGEPLPDTLENTASGAYTTFLDPDPDDPAVIDDVLDDLDLVPGDPALDVDKTGGGTLAPGQLDTFTLNATNSGTANLPDVTVSDPLPDGVAFDDSYQDVTTGLPYTITWTNLPSGYPPPPDAVFETTPDPADTTRIGMLRWSFPGWEMPPNASVAILYRYSLAPGVESGDVITNTMGASSPIDGLECSDTDTANPNHDTADTSGDFGTGLYCTNPAEVEVTSGANFASRKWVAGNPDLGWYNESTGELVDVGGGGCRSLVANGRTYTTNPCIAIVNPGEDFHYVLRVQNAGTEAATEMVVVDTFPYQGDTGVSGGQPRGTQWSNAPTFAGPAVYNGASSGTITYSNSTTPCLDELNHAGACAPGDWSPTWSASTAALQLSATFDPDPLAPGELVDVYFSMTTPVEVPWVEDPTVAYNSLAHSEVIEGGTVQPTIEPLKVGVATLYGNLEVVKEIGRNPGFLPLDDTVFTFAYDCTLTNGSEGAQGSVTATPTTPGIVEHIAAGSTCDVWETGTNGGIPSATPGDPVTVVIEPSLDDDPVISSVTVTNDFPFGAISVLKTVDADANADLTVGPYPVTADCTFDDQELRGFPRDFEVTPGEPRFAFMPVGSVCTLTETDSDGATVTYDPPNDDGTAAEGTVPADGNRTLSFSIINTFDTGSLVITKEVTGPGAPAFSTGPFFFGVSCAYGDNTTAMVVIVPGSDDGTPVESEPVTGLPVGSTCTITEVDNGGADSTPEPQTVVIGDGEIEVVFADFENPFSAGTISVLKVVDGDAADTPYVEGLQYTIAVECALDVDGTRVSLVDEDVIVAGDGVPVTVTDDGGDPVLLPLGTRCWGTETASGGATTISVDHDSYDTGVEVVADVDGGVQPLEITATNTFDIAELTVSKLVVNERDSNAMYTFTVDCTIADADGATIESPLLSGTSPVSLGADESATFEVLSGSVCEVAETDSGGGTPSIAETGGTADADTTDGLVTVDDARTVTITNTFPSGVLPFTGSSNASAMLLWAIGALAAGAALIGVTRRRRLAAA